jgi:hypothetical protein
MDNFCPFAEEIAASTLKELMFREVAAGCGLQWRQQKEGVSVPRLLPFFVVALMMFTIHRRFWVLTGLYNSRFRDLERRLEAPGLGERPRLARWMRRNSTSLKNYLDDARENGFRGPNGGWFRPTLRTLRLGALPPGNASALKLGEMMGGIHLKAGSWSFASHQG